MKVEILLKVIERVYSKNPGMPKMTDMWKEEDVSPEQVFFAFLYYWHYRYGLPKHKLFVCEGQLMKILWFVFSEDQERM